MPEETSIHFLPRELIEQILLELDPLDVACFSQTCKAYNALVYHSPDSHLWRSLYLLQPFDDPRKCLSPLLEPVDPEFIDWKTSLQRIMRARTVAASPALCKPHERETVLRTFIDMAKFIPPMFSVDSDDISLNLIWIAATLRGGELLDHNLWELSEEEAQLRAHLHACFGLTPFDAQPARKIQSLGYVYDMRHYRYDNAFGPYIPDGGWRVNWEHVLALHHDVSMHLVDIDATGVFEYVIFPMSLPYCQSVVPRPLESLGGDWAGVAGTWQMVFCFIDHRVLLRYNNFNRPSSKPLDPSFFGDPDFDEAFRSMPLELRVLSTEDDPRHPKYPRIHFGGKHEDYTIAGMVELTPHRDVRWHWIFKTAGEDGTPVWSCEGVQMGNVRSPFGVLGAWTTVFHDEHDPAGPVWMHKTSQSTNAEPNDSLNLVDI